ncbi:cardiolipin synthase [Paenibacillus sp. KQZ6P-2]|uniref:Cardiolipin synthase n=1 Tax=Paenibacillus mangrovi TaxID=2931978 RepID=A0A9X1WSR9_9BACL|nr:cardiolipin synthase [Paenibacillus mangrovi]MCJ8014409.1 cardiolipin synthase [Paenibacillus mangrovi]
MVWLLSALIIFIFQIATILLLEFRNPSKTIAWLFILFCCPIIGFVVYCFVAQDYKARRQVRTRGSRLFRQIRSILWSRAVIVKEIGEMHNPEFEHQERLFNLLSKLSESPITGCNASRVLTDGEEAFGAMLKAMEAAREHIHIEFYIFRHDVIGTQFQEIMIRKAKEGVKVRFMCDGLGSYKLKREFVEKLKEAGVQFYFFLPPLLAFIDRRINYRNHRKIIVVDGLTGFVGGLNVGDDYLGQYPNMGYWRDTHLQIQGDAVYYLQNVFLNDWQLASGEKIVDPALYPEHACEADEQIQIISSGPDQNWNAIQELCFSAISVAKKRIWITSPYFIPDPGVYEGMKTAAVSGVDVRIIIPWRSDSRLVHLASLSYVEELLLAGVRFYQYQKGFIHAKVMIVDQLLASVGTANMDMRSFFCNFELTAALFEQSSIERLAADFEEDMRVSREMTKKEFQERAFLHKKAEMLCRMLSPLL